MFSKGIDFPQYRKLSNNKVFYYIINEREFHEIQLIGNSAQLFKIKAEKYPELLKIKDLIDQIQDGVEELEKSQFEELMVKFNLS